MTFNLRQLWLTTLLIVFAIYFTISVANGSTIYVDDDNYLDPFQDGSKEHPYDNIRQAEANANSGDIIRVYEGTYREGVDIDVWISIKGNSSSNTIIDALDIDYALNIQVSNCVIQDLSIINGDDSGIHIEQHIENTIIDNCLIQNNENGLFIDQGMNTSIINCQFNDNIVGLLIQAVNSHTIISHNSFIDNNNGIEIDDGNFLFIDHCTFSSSDNAGIFFFSICRNSRITNNTFNTNNIAMISWYNFENNQIAYNEISNSDYSGMYLDDASDNIIHYNNYTNNGAEGIHFAEDSWGNTVVHNNFIDNNDGESQGSDSDGNNLWDDGSVGNFWNDYNGTDSNGDNIGDTPYQIQCDEGEAFDNYPLMEESSTIHSPNIPPTIEITSLVNGEKISLPLSIIGTASDEDGKVISVFISFNHGPWLQASGTHEWSFEWTDNNVSMGSHCVKVKAYDGMSYSSTIQIDVVVIESSASSSDDNTPSFTLHLTLVSITIILILKKSKKR